MGNLLGIITLDLGPSEANVLRNSRADLDQAGLTERKQKLQSSKELESCKGSVGYQALRVGCCGE